AASFFACFCCPLDLHSFPTRRSSDLGNGLRLELVATEVGEPDHVVRDRACSGARDRLPAALEYERGALVTDRRWLARVHDALQRSEEHTSELQSRENLVCRLLLEKKK